HNFPWRTYRGTKRISSTASATGEPLLPALTWPFAPMWFWPSPKPPNGWAWPCFSTRRPAPSTRETERRSSRSATRPWCRKVPEGADGPTDRANARGGSGLEWRTVWPGQVGWLGRSGWPYLSSKPNPVGERNKKPEGRMLGDCWSWPGGLARVLLARLARAGRPWHY